MGVWGNRCFLLLALGCAQAAFAAEAGLPYEGRWGDGLVWEQAPVRAPLAEEDVAGTAPYLPPRVPEVTGAVDLKQGQSAALWLSPLDVVQVKAPEGALRFSRVAGEREAQSSYLRLEESGIPARAGAFYLSEPVGEGSVWVLTATKDARVEVLRPREVSTPLAEEALRAKVLGWITEGQQAPPLPADAELRLRLSVDEQVSQALLRGVAKDAPLQDAVRSWRVASALQGLALRTGFDATTTRTTWPALDGRKVTLEGFAGDFYETKNAEGAYSITARGPAVLSVEARALLGTGGAPALELAHDGRVVATRELRLAQAHADDAPAVPTQRPGLTNADEQALGLVDELRIAIPSGEHTFRIAWRGGRTLLRARVAQHRPWARELFSGRVDWDDWANDAWQKAQAIPGARGQVLRGLIAELDPTRALTASAVPNDVPPALRALATLQAFDATKDTGVRATLAKAAAQNADKAWGDAPKEWAWTLRLRAARALLSTGAKDAARALLRSAPEFPNQGWLAAEAADVVRDLPLGDPLRSRALAALELAWRADPLSGDLKRRYASAWSEQSRWLSLSPARDPDVPALSPARFLDRTPLEPGDEAGASALWPLDPGTRLRVTAQGDALSGEVLRAFVVSTTAGALSLTVGGLSVPVPSLFAVEPVEVALPPGQHEVTLSGPAGARAWLSLPTASSSDAGEVAYLRTMWPARQGHHPVRFAIPDPQLPSPVRVQLRASAQTPKPQRVWLRTDTGVAVAMLLTPGATGPDHVALDGEPSFAASAADAVVLLPPFTRQVWFDAEQPDATLFASVSVRRDGRAPEAPAAPLQAEKKPPQIERLLELSRRLNSGDDSADLLLERAALLLDAAEEGLARGDLTRLLARQPGLDARQQHALNELLARADVAFADRVSFAQPLTQPTLLSPGYAAFAKAGDASLVPVFQTAREKGAPQALELLKDPSTPAERDLRARLLLATGDAEQAALEWVRLYRDSGNPAVGLDAARALEQLQGSDSVWRDWGAPVAFALSSQLLSWAELPVPLRLNGASARWARWSRLHDAEAQVGTINLVHLSPATQLDDQVRKAVLAPPWPLAQVRIVSAGNASVLQVEGLGPAEVGAQLLCGSVHPDRLAPRSGCEFELRLDGRTAAQTRATFGEVAKLSVPVPDAGPHQLEIALKDSEDPLAAAVRFVRFEQDGTQTALASELPLPALRARADEPVEVVIAGPTAIQVEGRTLGDGGDRALQLTDEDRKPLSLTLPKEADPYVRGVPVSVGAAATTYLLLPEPGPHRLRVTAQGGEALVRISVGRSDTPGRAGPRWWANAPTALEPLPWPALPSRLSLLPEPAAPRQVGDLGTLTLQTGVLGQDLETDGELDHVPLTSFDARVAWRKALVDGRVWALVEPMARLPLAGGQVFGGRAAGYARELPLGLRVGAEGALYTQAYGDGRRSSVRARASVDRWFNLGTDFGLLPGVGFTLERFDGGNAQGVWDPLVFWRYGVDHPQRLQPRLGLYWRPLIDQLGELTAYAGTNADLVTLDHASARARWSALLPFIPGARGELAYTASYRFQDLNRQEAYLRHGLRARVDVGTWTGSAGRLLVFAEDAAWLSGPFGLQNVVSAGLRWDWTFGRGLRDVMPFEEDFEDLLDDPRAQ